MIIEAKEGCVNFEVLKAGDVFRYGNAYYMKTEPDYDESMNAIELENGEISEFYPAESVVKVNAKLVIE